jgi:hypothetical protein
VPIPKRLFDICWLNHISRFDWADELDITIMLRHWGESQDFSIFARLWTDYTHYICNTTSMTFLGDDQTMILC